MGELPDEPFEPEGLEEWGWSQIKPGLVLGGLMLFTAAGHTAALADSPTADEPEITSQITAASTAAAVTMISDTTLGTDYRADDPERQRARVTLLDFSEAFMLD